MTHKDLVQIAADWLKKNRCSVVITELATGGECPDAIGWRGPFSTLVECKISRCDFSSDRKKPFRSANWLGVGLNRYFLTPPGLLSVDDLPPKWGLLEFSGDKLRVAKKSELFRVNNRHEVSILLSCLRRIGHLSPRGVSIRCYTIESQNTATVSLEHYAAQPQS